jgi:Acetyltransferase (GNAT) domain
VIFTLGFNTPKMNVIETPENSHRPVREEIRVLYIDTLEELSRHGAAWNELSFRIPQRLPMLSHAWISTYFGCRLRSHESWICILVYDRASLIGVLPLIVTRHNLCGLKRSTVSTPFDWHTVSVDFIVEPGREDEVMPLLLSCLSRIKPAPAGLRLKRLLDCSPIKPIIKHKMKGFAAVCRLSGYGSYIKVGGSYKDYSEGLETRFVRNLRRLERRLRTMGELEYQLIDDKAGNEECLNRFLEIEASGWKGRNGTAIARSASLLKFYSTLTARLAGLGWLEWHFLNLRGKAIAAILAIRFDRKLVILKIGYDEAYSSFSPGNKLFEKMVQRAFASGRFDEIDCLSKYAWNEDWKMQSRMYYDLSIFPKHRLAFLTHYPVEKLYCMCEGWSVMQTLNHFLHNNSSREI